MHSSTVDRNHALKISYVDPNPTQPSQGKLATFLAHIQTSKLGRLHTLSLTHALTFYGKALFYRGEKGRFI